MLLTHAHIDHSGLLPKLVREGFRGPIMATRGTIDLCSCMLPDSGSIQEAEVAALNRRNTARGRARYARSIPKPMAWPHSMRSGRSNNQTWFEAMPGIRARYWNAGHLLGSASIEIEFIGQGGAGAPLRVLLSGDVGPDAKLLQPDPEAPAGLDYVISESTYGDSDRPSTTAAERRARTLPARCAMLRAAKRPRDAYSGVRRGTDPGIDRRSDRPDAASAKSRPRRFFSTSPLAIRATEVFRRHAAILDPSIDLDRLLSSPQLRFTETVDESKSIARLSGFHIIIAASGMCDAGRIPRTRAQPRRGAAGAAATVQ